MRAQALPLAQILEAGGAYVEHYEGVLSKIVSEEDYVQRLRTRRNGGVISTRRLRSDVLLAKTSDAGWVAFRDVFEVDGRSVRDRKRRLEALFLEPSAESEGQALKITQESARFNLGQLNRTINVPTLALAVLRADRRARCRFELERLTHLAGQQVAQVKFVEVGEHRLVATPDDASAEGRLWIEPVTGRVVKTEFGIRTAGSESLITVTYGADTKLGLWVPVAMAEEYVIPVKLDPVTDTPSTLSNAARWKTTSAQYLDARATYSHFRQFGVTTRLKVGDK